MKKKLKAPGGSVANSFCLSISQCALPPHMQMRVLVVIASGQDTGGGVTLQVLIFSQTG